MVGLADNWTLPKPCLDLMQAAKENGQLVEIVGYEHAYHAFDHPNLPIRTRTARDNKWKDRERKVTIGSNPAAREDAIRRLHAWLARHLLDE
jgi:dienelactone hydrolase